MNRDHLQRAARLSMRCALAMLLILLISIGPAGSAAAHDVLIASDPAAGATVHTSPSRISFTFDEPVQNFDPVVSLVGPDGRQYAVGTPVISGNVVTGTVGAGPSGAYIAAYRIVSADGHPVTGEVRFTLSGDTAAGSAAARSAAASPASAPSPPAATSAARPAPGNGLSAGIWIALVVAALIIAAAAVVLLRRPLRPSPGRSTTRWPG